MKELFYFIEQDVRIGITIIFACCVFTVLATFFDMWTAIEAVKASGGKPSSHPMKRTGQKIIDYLRLIFFVLMIDILGLLCFTFYNIPYCVVVMTAGILIREGLSMRENYRLKKSGAAQVVDMAAKIVACITSEDAEKIIKAIKDSQNVKYKN